MVFLLFGIVRILRKQLLDNLPVLIFCREQHLKYFQEEVDVEPPDSETLSDDGKKEGDADDEEDGGQQDVHRRENEQLQKHFHFWNFWQKWCLTRPLFDASFMATYDILKPNTSQIL